MVHLNNALNQINSTFTTNWVSNFSSAISVDDISIQQNVLDAEVAILGFLDGFANPFFEKLNFSVISGEYSTDISAARHLIDSIENEFRTLALFHVPNFPQMLSVYQEVFQSAFLHPIRQSLKHYRSLLDSVERHLSYKPGTSMIFHSIEDDKDLSRKIMSAAVSVSELFLMNIDIAKIDHSISFTREGFKIILLLLLFCFVAS